MKTRPELISTPKDTIAPPAVVKYLLAAAMLGSLLFAHGCHGPDEDHELITNVLAYFVSK